MALTIHAEGGALVFRSAGYSLRIGRLRLALPRFLSPGALTVRHAELGDGRFAFTLALVHPHFGELIGQKAVFADASRRE